MNVPKFNLLACIASLIFFGEVFWSVLLAILYEQATMQEFEWNIALGILTLFLIITAAFGIWRRGEGSRINSLGLILGWIFAALLLVTSFLQHLVLKSFGQLISLVPEIAVLLSVPFYFIVKKKSDDERSAANNVLPDDHHTS